MMKSPRGIRLHIGIFGRRNAGKSSILNALTRQDVSIVSARAGTTTDPVEKPMELLPVGPVLFIDTAGIDDTGDLGEKRVERTLQVLERTDLGLIVSPAGEWGDFEHAILGELKKRNMPVIAVFNKIDLALPERSVLSELEAKGVAWAKTAATENRGIIDLINAIVGAAPPEFLNMASIAGDLVPAGRFAVLVAPIDKEAPKGRLILPQAQTIRDLLDHDACCVVVQENRLKQAIAQLRTEPALVITDSQAFASVARDTPDHIPLTSFSILFARFKGDLDEFVSGALAIRTLKPGDRVLVAEACAHHPIADDIGRVKIPNWIRRYVDADLEFTHVQGHDFPGTCDELGRYGLVVHCGSCTLNRKEVLSRIMRCRAAGVPITNYGVAIAFCLGIMDRALGPFPSSRALI